MWDAGELIAAVHTFGIPHQPGTPLYVLLARSWSLALPFLSTALATNLFSAMCTAAAGGLLAAFLARASESKAMALAGALCAGGMFTVWSSATETEVYASALLLVMLALLTAERAGRTGEARWRVATVYALALAVPLHLSVLVAAPAALVLLMSREDGTVDWLSGARLAGMLLLVAGIGLSSVPVAATGACATAAIALYATRAGRRANAESAAMLACALLALSAVAVLVVRARFDPAVNEGAPTTLRALWDVVGRRQYGAGGMWPRQAPLWAQLANWFEYADWQVALGMSNGVAPAWSRTPITIAFALLGVYGSREHLRMHVRSWRALATLFACASLGLIVYLNFKAGASFGIGVLDRVPHEVRDRDYFFVLGFWVWGAWAGIGAVALAAVAGVQWVPLGVLAAAAPLALNAPAADRRAEPERSVALAVAHALLASAPPNAVLFTGGDNDSFPLWYAQAVERMRPDVTIVVAPLLGTEWYRAQLARRASLVTNSDVVTTRDAATMIEGVAREARARGRPIAASLMSTAEIRRAAGDLTVARGLVYVEPALAPHAIRLGGEAPSVDTAAATAIAREYPLAPRVADAELDDGIDPAPDSFLGYLRCPAQFLAVARGLIVPASLDSVCKLR